MIGWLFKLICPWIKNILFTTGDGTYWRFISRVLLFNYFKTKTKFVLLKNQHILPILILGVWLRLDHCYLYEGVIWFNFFGGGVLESVMGKNPCWPWLPHESIMKTLSILLGLCKTIMEVVDNPVLKSVTDFEYSFSFP